MSLPRLLLIVLAAILLLWIAAILVFSTLLAGPTGDSGDGRFPGRTITGPKP
ncbi:MAG: hypothetical protein ACXWZ1_12070 [Gaiellaceae bacterium]